MASKQALSRLRKELKTICADPPPHIHVFCDEANILNWSYLLEGPPETPYEGGWYWGRLKFPKDYPFAPPSILMVTPSGRFEPNTRLCLSMSDYHPESWQPAWSLATVLKGLLSFMCEDAPTAGSVCPLPSPSERRRLAAESLTWNKSQAEFLRVFPDVDRIVGASISAARKAEPCEASTGAPAFGPGDKVVVMNLKARADLNGQEGVVEPPSDGAVAPGRVCVHVAGERVGIKPENLQLVSREGGTTEKPSVD